jgi:hypothetical protein
MFNDFCFALNRLRLAWLVALLRCTLSLALRTWGGAYANPAQIGYQGWIESRIGVLAFRRMDGGLLWRW